MSPTLPRSTLESPLLVGLGYVVVQVVLWGHKVRSLREGESPVSDLSDVGP